VDEEMSLRTEANIEALARFNNSNPVLVEIRPAGDVIPGMTADTVLTSGAPQKWDKYHGGQRRALIYGAIYEGIAADEGDAEQKFAAGRIKIGACHEHGCVGSVAGIYTASMPVFVVENRAHGNQSFCNFYEGESRKRLNYGSYDADVRDGLDLIRDTIAPVLGEAIAASGGIPLKPIMARALHMGDELHSRNTAATLLFSREIFPHLLRVSKRPQKDIEATLSFLQQSDYFFLRLSMAAAKAIADAAHGIEGSSLVTAMTLSCNDFAIRVSGLAGQWYRGPLPDADVKLFDGFTKNDVQWIGGESQITETVGLGGFAQAAAFALQAYQGGSPEAMVEMNKRMYSISEGENAHFTIPYLSYRGTPTGIDIFRVAKSGIVPVIDAGLAGKGGGQIGAGILRAPVACFEAAREAYLKQYGD
jgi:Protein of unknown function (DUF1116)